tara:strand:- start:588 stop:1001 length:414 start_codon:yes stop_codon:yes gene_type:complete
MRKIEAQMLEAIDLKKNWSLANMRVQSDDTGICVYLHDNLICQIMPNWPVELNQTKDLICLKDAGWQTVTTKSRLNRIADFFGLPGIYQKNFKWFTDSRYKEEWQGHKTYELKPNEYGYKGRFIDYRPFLGVALNLP